MTHSTTFKMAGCCVNHVPWHTRKSRDMCLCLQHPEQHTLFMAVYSSNKTHDEIQSSLWYSTTSELSKRVSWEFCVEQRDVLIRFRSGVWRGWFGGADRRGRLKKWVMPNSAGWGAGRCTTIRATLPTPRLPPTPSPPPNTSLLHVPSFINASRARALWTALMNRDEERRGNVAIWLNDGRGLEHERPIKLRWRETCSALIEKRKHVKIRCCNRKVRATF